MRPQEHYREVIKIINKVLLRFIILILRLYNRFNNLIIRGVLSNKLLVLFSRIILSGNKLIIRLRKRRINWIILSKILLIIKLIIYCRIKIIFLKIRPIMRSNSAILKKSSLKFLMILIIITKLFKINLKTTKLLLFLKI
jgi:hypothetical protein